VNRPLADRDSAPWWAALAENRLLLQRCGACSAPRLVPRALCNACGSFAWSWVQASGDGTVVSWTVSHRTFQPGRPAPFVVVLVRLAESANLILPGGWSGAADGSDLAVGLAVHADYVPCDGEADSPPAALLSWRPAPTERLRGPGAY
jgi:uncharacterized OB-fold protein